MKGIVSFYLASEEFVLPTYLSFSLLPSFIAGNNSYKVLLLPSSTLLWPETLPFVPSAPLQQCHILCDNSQPGFMTLSGHRCHFCPSSGRGPRGTSLTVPPEQPSSLLHLFLQLHAPGACTASRITITFLLRGADTRQAAPAMATESSLQQGSSAYQGSWPSH